VVCGEEAPVSRQLFPIQSQAPRLQAVLEKYSEVTYSHRL
jgi:hypothetical protein